MFLLQFYANYSITEHFSNIYSVYVVRFNPTLKGQNKKCSSSWGDQLCKKLLIRVHVTRVKYSRGSYVNDLQLPQILHTLQSPVTVCKKVGQIFVQAEAVQPRGERCAAITAQRFYLQIKKKPMTQQIVQQQE